MTALTRTTAGAAAVVLRAAMYEVGAVARAQGIALNTERVELVLAHAQAEFGALWTSMLQDLERGRRLQHEALNGSVVRSREAVGVPTPVHRTLYCLLAAFDTGREPPTV